MNRFHSSGTASGNVDRMCTWKMTMPITAMVPIVPPLVTSSSSGSVNSITVPMCAVSAPSREGRRSSGWLVYSRRLANLDRFHGVLLIITDTTNGKWRLSFDEAAPHQMPTKVSCAATIRLLQREQADDEQRPVDLGAGGQERDLVAQPQQAQERQRHPHGGRLQAHGRAALPRHQQVDAAGQQPRVQQHVDRGAGAAGGQRHPLGPRRLAHGARPQPVQDPADHRREAERQRHRPGPQADDLPQQRPHHELLEHDRLRSTSRRSRRCRPARAWWRR